MEYDNFFLENYWINASAGSGKTTKLINRIWQLLLLNNDQRILCITFTNAAAEEMQERIMHSMHKWSYCDNAQLKESVYFIFSDISLEIDSVFLNNMMNKAQLLWFNRKDKNIEIKTIHSFCNNILHNYAIDLGISPSFGIMDEVKSKIFLQEAFNEYISHTNKNIANCSQRDILLATQNIISSCSTWDIDVLHDKAIKKLRELFHVEQFPEHDIYTEDILDFIKHSLINKYYNADNFKLRNTKNSKFIDDNLEKIENWFAGDKLLLLSDYKNIFLRKDGDVRSNPCKKNDPVYDWVMDEQSKIKRLNDILIRFDDYAYGRNIINLSFDLLHRMQNKKKRLGIFSYNDLIALMNYALNDFSGCDGIKYDINKDFDHILIDEAQDNSLEQWNIIRAITEDFFCGEGTSRNKTLFVVGDVKQSIYSFQGAKPDAFIYNKEFFIQKANESNRSLCVAESYDCYRCDSEIINLVNMILKNDNLRKAITFSEKNVQQKSLSNGVGSVVLERISGANDTSYGLGNFWHAKPSDTDSIRVLMDKVANDIKNYIEDGVIYNNLGESRSPEYKDVLILVRKRGKYVNFLIASLNRFSIPYLLAYDTSLKDSVPINDLLNLCYMCLNPSDNLSLCIALKSPLFGYSEVNIMELYNVDFDLLRYSSKDYNIVLQLRRFAHLLSPYDFFCKILFSFDLMEKFAKCFGVDVYYVIDKFLEMVFSWEKVGIVTLGHLMKFIDNNDFKISRADTDNRVKISTVHGAKGKEAPLVIVIPEGVAGWGSDDPIKIDNGVPISVHGLSDVMTRIRKKFVDFDIEEDLRLLYVALTRAKHELRVYALDTNSNLSSRKKNWFEWLSVS
ncbi:hypothetical protein CAXC1_180052 [Candidatus Xenohaliotis californiensis]|uniref:DNA 3'-5' helicase n=1 Tax=Candidatus Xenohaliotis californiensis TaxID=84677 RepID=A0ABM9N7G1_9RICK|nr:hypothetical protein CAXC1_180052 [Candidatus Xenohaliotis californiensis]